MDRKERAEKRKEIEEKKKAAKAAKKGDTAEASETENSENESMSEDTRLEIIDEGLRRKYLSRLSEMEISAVTGLPDADQDLTSDVRMYHVTEIDYRKEDNIADRLTTVFNTLSACTGSVFAVIDSNGEKAEFYIGVRNNDLTSEKAGFADLLGETLETAVRGNMSGVRMEACDAVKIREVSDRILQGKSVSSVSVKGSFRSESNSRDFTQGLENLISAMQGRKYTGIIIADAGSQDTIEDIRRNLQELYTKLSAYRNTNYGETGDSEDADSKSYSKMSNKEKIKALGDFLLNMAGIAGGVAAMGAMGALVGSMISGQVTGFINSMATAIENSKGTGTSTDSVSLYENRKVTDLLGILDDAIKRTEEFERYGMWSVAGYFTSDDTDTALMAAANYKALMCGDGLTHELAAINIWKTEDNGDSIDEIRKCLSRFIHPTFIYCKSEGEDQNTIYTNAAAMVTGKELALHMGFPRA